MKILLPYATHAAVVNAKGPVVAGGIEKFCKDLEDNIEGVIPVFVTKEDKDSRRTKKVIQEAIAKHNPDMIIFNNPWWGNMMISFNVPLVCIVHEGLVRDIRIVELGNILRRLKDNGAHTYFVSPRQLDFHRKTAMRINGVDFGDIAGFINPSYLHDSIGVSDELLYDCGTVGRSDTLKVPFLVHKKLHKSNLNSLVMTNDVVYKSDSINAYVDANKHWQAPQHTLRGLPHAEVMTNLAKCRTYCSTCSKESWGITAMEALGCGVPLILMCDDSDNHSSEIIAADESHYVKLSKDCSDEVFADTIKSIMNLSADKRLEISRMTKEKHSLKNWKLAIDNLVGLRYNDRSKQSNDLMGFFNE